MNILILLLSLVFATPSWAALSTHAGEFTIAGSSTTDITVSSLSFQPKAIVFYYTHQAAAGFAAHLGIGMGFATDRASDQNYSISGSSQDNVATTVSTYQRRVADAIVIRRYDGTTLTLADVTAYASNGFTIGNISNSNTSDSIIKYFAIGGTDLEDAYVGVFSDPASTGDETFTGVPFQGDLLIAIAPRIDTSTTDATGGSAAIMFGAASSSSQRAVTTNMWSTGSTSNPHSESYISNDAVLAYYNTARSIVGKADFVAWTSDGFTLNYSAVTNATAWYGLILKGTFQSHIGVQARKITTTGTVAYTTPGFLPTGLFLAGAIATAVNTETAEGHLSLGATDGTNQHSIWVGDAGPLNTDANSYSNASNVYTQATNPSTFAAQAAISSFDSTGYTLNYGTVDGNARQFMHVALGSAASSRRPIAPLLFSWLEPVINFFLPREAVACCS